MVTDKARVTTINYAGLEFEGLMLPNGKYAIALIQVNEILKLGQQKSATTAIKRILGKDYKVSKFPTELTKNKVNILTLEEFSKILMLTAFNGNKISQGFMLASTTEKLERVFAKAFEQKFDEEQAEVKFQARMQHAKQFHPIYTSYLKNDNPNRKDYGTQVNNLKRAAGLPIKISVDDYDAEQLIKMNQIEVAYSTLRNIGYDHYKALKSIQ